MEQIRKRRVLCPIEFEVNSIAALDLARDIAPEINGILYVLHVISPPSSMVVSSQLLFERIGHFARIELDEIARESLGDIDHHLLVRTGQAADEILAAANELKADIIVMATHSRAGAPGFSLGSVTEKVIREAPCPVLTIRRALEPESFRAARPHESCGS